MDPSGHSWKSFWKKVGDWFKDEFLEPFLAFTVTLIFSGGSIPSAIAAAIATAALDTGEGRQFIKRTAEEVFDDAFGMRPRAAYFWSYFVIEALLTAALSYGINSMVNSSNVKVVRPDKLTAEQRDQYNAIKNDPKAMGTKVSGTEISKISEKTYRALVVDGQVKAIIANVPIEFFGIPLPFLEHTALAIPGGGPDFRAGLGYLWWNRVCHQERMLYLKSIGIDKITPLDLSWNFSTWLSYGVYGSYGQQGATIDNIGKAVYHTQKKY